ncbi:MAG: serine/threonine-protein kinase [Streptosporangiaceae bacterium]
MTVMTTQQLIEDALAALGVEDAEPLTRGGQKLVLKGRISGAIVVVKIVPLPEGPAKAVVLERANREVDLLAAVSSNHVVKVVSDAIEVGAGPQAVAWAEEYLDGEDLGRLLTRRWTDEEVFRLLADVAAGLRACHELDVVHRDLSPGNVRRLPSDRYVLMDPGLARHLERTALTGLYQPGTTGFRSPEHVPGGKPIPASDIFCLGILAFYARTGQLPIDASGDDNAYFTRLKITQAPAVQNVQPSTGLELARIIDRSLHRQPARRYLDGSELANVLTEIGYDPS